MFLVFVVGEAPEVNNIRFIFSLFLQTEEELLSTCYKKMNNDIMNTHI